MLKVKIYEYESPCGKLWLAAKRGSLCLCDWAGSKNLTDILSRLSKALEVEFILPSDCSTAIPDGSLAPTSDSNKLKKNAADSSTQTEPAVQKTPAQKVADKPTAKVLVSAIKQLSQYFSGRRKSFNIPYLLAGTPFQDAVWKSLLDIPYGKSVSYADIASMAGYPKAVRAAANACGDNALSVIIPCHRVIGSDTGLTGYGGGLGVKRYLLDLESSQQRLPFGRTTKKATKKTATKKTVAAKKNAESAVKKNAAAKKNAESAVKKNAAAKKIADEKSV